LQCGEICPAAWSGASPFENTKAQSRALVKGGVGKNPLCPLVAQNKPGTFDEKAIPATEAWLCLILGGRDPI
jgi:hypothetical protein